ncbi:hypothetical protein LP420_21660 [Massilia sp. B-10]|nr:hypothetical protein LP420_21660 [Massilia sp. B-10]
MPPIPQAFDLAAARHPLIVLHDADGNHSACAGCLPCRRRAVRHADRQFAARPAAARRLRGRR